jgi:hypothetical protein
MTFASDAENLDLLAIGNQRVRFLAGKPHDCRVERSAKTPFGRAND